MIKIKIERWKHYGRVVTIRENRRILSWHKKESNVKLQIYRNLYRINGTLNPKIKKVITPLSKVVQVGYFGRTRKYDPEKESKIKLRDYAPRRKDKQYFIELLEDGKVKYTFSSYKLNRQNAIHGNSKEEARSIIKQKFLEKLDLVKSHDFYNEEKRFKVDKSKTITIREGWGYYTKKREDGIY